MSSIVGHVISGYALSSSFGEIKTKKFIIIGILCSILPDIDIFGFYLGVPYDSFWGHRGFTHSIIFALIISFLITCIFFQKEIKKNKKFILFYLVAFFLVIVLHDLLDMLTNGGLGIAFFLPFDDARYFLSWQPIQVSPLGIDRFFSILGLKVIFSELLCVWIPSLMYIIIIKILNQKNIN